MSRNNPYTFIVALITGLILSVAISVWATSIGNNISVTGTLSSTGALSITTTSATSTTAYGFTMATGGGNVGIGTSTPSGVSLLSVGTNSASNSAYFAGNVGIGTAAPSSKLHVIATDASGGIFSVSGTSDNQKGIYAENLNTGDGEYGGYFAEDPTNPTGTTFTGVFTYSVPTGMPSGATVYGFYSSARNRNGNASAYAVGGYFNSGSGKTSAQSASTLNITKSVALIADAAVGNADTATPNVFEGKISGVTRFIIDGTGRLGIGTTSPGALLSLAASSGATTNSQLLLSGIDTVYASSSTTTIPSAVNTYSFATGNSATPLLSFDTTNTRIGVGTSTPFANFSIDTPNNTSTSTLNIGTKNSTTKGSCIQLYTPTGAPVRVYATTTPGPLIAESGSCQ